MSEQGPALVYVCDRSEIDLGRRELRVRGAATELGGRSFDIIEQLVQSGGQIVTKDELIGSIWGGAIIEENTLQVHISAIRKALGPDRSLLRTVFGRGYQLLGIWTIHRDHEAAPGKDHAATAPVAAMPGESGPGRAGHVRDDLLQQSAGSSHNLPVRITRTLGRDRIVQSILERFATERFVSVTGPGGIGKTTVAIAVGQRLLDAFEGAVRFVDLGPVGDPSLLADAVASALGLAVRTEDPISGLASFLRDRRMLLILDSCEHVIEAAAALAERIYQEAPRVQILATSREALRIDGECVQVLPPLDTPPERSGITATEALTFPAVQLFVERAVAGDSVFALSDADAPLVADICRTLDGMALAIELAAGRVGAFGVRGIARLIDGQFQLQWPGRRTALPRHRTLAATLDWSHALLSEPERIVFRRLSVFVGGFVGLKPVLAVSAFGGLNESMVVDAFDGLVAKSLVAADFSRTPIRYRLLDTTRAYAAAKLQASGDASLVGRCHASWFRDFLVQENAGLSESSGSALCAEHVGNLRAALEWSFGDDGDREIASTLAAAAAPLFLRLSLLAECHRWTERAMIALDASLRGTRLEMEQRF